jgi:nucleotide-binding universal stress UspA family protein
LNKIVVPLDGSDVSEAVLPYIEEAAPKLKAQVALLQVVEPTHYAIQGSVARVQYTEKEINQLKAKARDYLEKAGAGLKSKGVAITFEVAVGKAAEEIVNFASKTNADLVAMATHGWSGFSRLFLGSVADRVLHTGNTPLLLVKPPSTPSTQ